MHLCDYRGRVAIVHREPAGVMLEVIDLAAGVVVLLVTLVGHGLLVLLRVLHGATSTVLRRERDSIRQPWLRAQQGAVMGAVGCGTRLIGIGHDGRTGWHWRSLRIVRARAVALEDVGVVRDGCGGGIHLILGGLHAELRALEVRAVAGVLLGRIHLVAVVLFG